MATKETRKAFLATDQKRKNAEKLLKPCPLCLGKARILPQEYGLQVDCIACGLRLPVYSRLFVSAVCSWNYRDGQLETTADDYGNLGEWE